MFKSIDIDPEIQSDSELASVIKETNRSLESFIGKDSGQIGVRWRIADNRDVHHFLRLTLSDAYGAAEGYYHPSALITEKSLRWHLGDLYGDLLQNRSHKLLEKLMAGSVEASEQ